MATPILIVRIPADASSVDIDNMKDAMLKNSVSEDYHIIYMVTTKVNDVSFEVVGERQSVVEDNFIDFK